MSYEVEHWREVARVQEETLNHQRQTIDAQLAIINPLQRSVDALSGLYEHQEREIHALQAARRRHVDILIVLWVTQLVVGVAAYLALVGAY